MLQDLDDVQVMTEVEVSEMLFEPVDMIEKKVSFQFNSHIKKKPNYFITTAIIIIIIIFTSFLICSLGFPQQNSNLLLP